MARYLIRASYTAEGVQGLLKEGGASRREAVRKLAEQLGGSMETFDFAFGDDDVYTIIELPNNTSAATASLLVGSSGAVRSKTIVLVSPEEIDDATKMSAEYRPPGA